MTKKNFKNPALNFISRETIEEVDGKPEGLQFTGKAPEGYKINHAYIETRSKRLQLLVQPSLEKKYKDLSKQYGVSFNDLINRVLYKALSTDGFMEQIRKETEEG